MRSRALSHLKWMGLVLPALFIFWQCTKDEPLPVAPETEEVTPNPDPTPDPTPDPQPEPGKDRVIPSDLKDLPRVYIDTPGHVGVSSKEDWVESVSVKILGDGNELLLEDSGSKIRGRGNSTWSRYPKKPYYIKLGTKADLYGTGKSKKWVLLANWMDRTLLRNQVAFHAASLTSLDWTPSGGFVELYLDGKDLGIYWLGEKINVEGSKFEADYLFSLDTSDPSETHFTTGFAYSVQKGRWSVPVEVKYPDSDDYDQAVFDGVISDASAYLDGVGRQIRDGNLSGIDIDSFCDWLLVHELCLNSEPRHPKSCFFHRRDGILYAGPIWDFDWGTFTSGSRSLRLTQALWYSNLMLDANFKSRLKQRWSSLKPSFRELGAYIDSQADIIRTREAANHNMWPCYPNPLSEDGSGMVNYDEQLTFQEAVDQMKAALEERIGVIDNAMSRL